MTLENIVLLAFTGLNSASIFALLPQMLVVFASKDDCRSTSCATWAMFCFAEGSTALHAAVNQQDHWMTAVFATSTFCCLTIVVTILTKRASARRAHTTRRLSTLRQQTA